MVAKQDGWIVVRAPAIVGHDTATSNGQKNRVYDNPHSFLEVYQCIFDAAQ